MRQEKDEAETRRQHSRMEAMKRGEYMLFNPRTTSADEIAHAIWQQLQHSKKAAAKKPRRRTIEKKKGGDEKK